MARKFISFSGLFLLLLLTACTSTKELAVQNAWARPGTAAGNSAVYFVIDNPSSGDDILLSASSAVAASVELHQSMMGGDGMMMMQPQENVPIPGGQKVAFEPGGLHVMLVGLNDDLNVGDSFEVILNFQKAGAVTLEVMVREP